MKVPSRCCRGYSKQTGRGPEHLPPGCRQSLGTCWLWPVASLALGTRPVPLGLGHWARLQSCWATGAVGSGLTAVGQRTWKPHLNVRGQSKTQARAGRGPRAPSCTRTNHSAVSECVGGHSQEEGVALPWDSQAPGPHFPWKGPPAVMRLARHPRPTSPSTPCPAPPLHTGPPPRAIQSPEGRRSAAAHTSELDAPTRP